MVTVANLQLPLLAKDPIFSEVERSGMTRPPLVSIVEPTLENSSTVLLALAVQMQKVMAHFPTAKLPASMCLALRRSLDQQVMDSHHEARRVNSAARNWNPRQSVIYLKELRDSSSKDDL